MQTITIKVEDEAVDKVLELLSRLPKKQVEVISKLNQDAPGYVDKQSDKLAGMFAHYVTHRVTDEQVNNAITKGVTKRAMAGKGQ